MNSSSRKRSSKPIVEVAAPYKLVQARHGWMLVNPNDFFIGRAILEYGEYGEAEAQLLRQLFVRPGVVVEVGANIGTHTVPLAKKAAEERRDCFAFEPQPVIFQNLCANLALNGITHVRAWPWACGETAKTLYFRRPDYGVLGNFGAVEMHADVSSERDVAVSCVQLDEVLADHTVGLLKIDAEGFELKTLQGAVNLLARSRPVLYVENDRVDASRALIEWLWQQDYRLWWHVPFLFSPDNFFGNDENIYGDVASVNMLCLPKECTVPVSGLPAVTDAGHNPLLPLQPA